MSIEEIESILSQSETVQVIFKTDCQKLGVFLNGSENESLLKQGSKLQLPLWAVERLGEKRLIEVELPEKFGPEFQNVLKGNPEAANLKEKSRYYIESALKIIPLIDNKNETDRLKVALLTAVSRRYPWLVDKCYYSNNPKTTQKSIESMEKLSGLEEMLFKCGFNASHEVEMWKQGKAQGLHLLQTEIAKKRRGII